MSVIQLPSVRSYWSKSIGVESIKKAMPQKHFEKNCQYLHFKDNTHTTTREDPNLNCIYKLGPVINHLIERFQTVPYERDLSVAQLNQEVS